MSVVLTGDRKDNANLERSQSRRPILFILVNQVFCEIVSFGRMLAPGKRFNQSKVVLYDSVSFKDGKLATV